MSVQIEDLAKAEILAAVQKLLEKFDIDINEVIDRKIAEAEDKHLDDYVHEEKAVSVEELEKENP